MGAILGFEITYSGVAKISPRTWKRVKRAAYRGVAEYWYANIRPKKFTHEGAREYGFTPRSGEEAGIKGRAFWRSYTGRKLKKFGHTLPNVWKGSMRTETAKKRITAKYSGSRIRVHARVFNLYPNARTRVNPKAEMRQMSANDRKNLRKEAGRITMAELPKRHRGKTVVRIGAF